MKHGAGASSREEGRRESDATNMEARPRTEVEGGTDRNAKRKETVGPIREHELE